MSQTFTTHCIFAMKSLSRASFQCQSPGLCSKRILRFRSTAAAAAPGSTESQSDEIKPFSDIPGPPGLPWLGTLLQYRLNRGPFSVERFHEALLYRHEEYGKIFKETIMGHTIVHLFDPDYIKAMYALEGKIPHIPPLLETTQLYRKTRDMSPGLGNTNGDEWYRLRSAVQQMMMRPQAVTMFLPHVNDVIKDFIKRIQTVADETTGQISDFKNEILRWNLESSAMTCFETRLGCFDAGPDSFQQAMIDANTEIFKLSLKLRFSLPWFKLFPTPSWKRFLEKEDFFFGLGQKLVDETVEKIRALVDRGEGLNNRFGFLSYLMAKDELTYKDLSIITLSLFADGLSTTSPTLIGQLYCLAKNPDEQQRLYESIMEVCPDPSVPVTADFLAALTYLKACVKEGFRFFPVGTEVSRIPQNDIVIGGYQIPAGTVVELNNNMLLRLPEYFEEPDQYKPERWVRGGSASDIHPYLLLPFGFGPRTCAGRRFAEQEMLVLITKLLQHFRLEWVEPFEMGQKYVMLLTPDTPASFRFIPRR